MTAAELIAAKGQPLSKQDGNWSYKTGDDHHVGRLDVSWRGADGAADTVVSTVEYFGNEDSAPTDVPFLNGESKSDLFDRYGNPVDMRLNHDWMEYHFANGIVISASDDRVVHYGISQPKRAK